MGQVIVKVSNKALGLPSVQRPKSLNALGFCSERRGGCGMRLLPSDGKGKKLCAPCRVEAKFKGESLSLAKVAKFLGRKQEDCVKVVNEVLIMRTPQLG